MSKFIGDIDFYIRLYRDDGQRADRRAAENQDYASSYSHGDSIVCGHWCKKRLLC